jgi:hypothetical protein
MMARIGSTPLDPAIHRGRLDSLRIYEISEAELEALERGSPESVYLNLGLTVLSVATSFSITLATTKTESNRTFTVFVVLVAVGYLAGLTFGILWSVSRRSLTSTAAKIRARLPAEGIQERPRIAPEAGADRATT